MEKKLYQGSQCNKKPYQCSQYDKAFVQNSHLNDHLKTHAGGKPYKCSQDDEAFTQKCSLICHIKTHDGENHINTANVIRNYVSAANV